MSAPVEPSSALAPDVVLGVWRRRKWIGIAVFVIVLAGAISAVLSLPNLYRATATVLIERPQVSEAFVRQSVTAELETRIQTIHRQVMSRAHLADVINRLGLYPELRGLVPIDALVERLRYEAQLGIQGVEQSTGRTETIAFTLSYSGRDPEIVARVANTLAGYYVEGNTKSRERQATETAEFLKARLDEVKRELDQEERRASDSKARQAAELQQVEASLTALERLNTQLRLNSEAQMRALERRQRFEQQLADAESAPMAALAPDSPAAQLAKLKEQLALLRRQYSEQYPEVIRLRTAIAALEPEVASNGTNGHATAAPAVSASTRFARQSLATVESELRVLKEEEASLRTLIAGHEARIDNAPKLQQGLEQPSLAYDAVNERYQALVKRSEEAQLAENLERGQNTEQFRILDPAIPPLRPAAPNRLWLLLMGIAAAAGLGFAAIVVAEKVDTSFHTADDLQAFTNLPTLARIRLIQSGARRRRQRLHLAVIAAASIIGAVVAAAGAYYVAGNNEELVRMTVRSGD
ncbi:MAG TPA: Wzz/FepE/Etk N-terminal domain-containing protein [Vicinamibacterales bacterium]|nr:Wzz/FepE/Etk N-terminal domain-containing protein [Vicinamibacterales bacterium]